MTRPLVCCPEASCVLTMVRIVIVYMHSLPELLQIASFDLVLTDMYIHSNKPWGEQTHTPKQHQRKNKHGRRKIMIPQICLIRNFLRLSGSLWSPIRLKDGDMDLSAHWENSTSCRTRACSSYLLEKIASLLPLNLQAVRWHGTINHKCRRQSERWYLYCLHEHANAVLVWFGVVGG